MLYVKIKAVDEELQFHCNVKNELSNYAHNVERISADGDELVHILSEFVWGGIPTIPVPRSKRVVTWFGDHAKAIASAWPRYYSS